MEKHCESKKRFGKEDGRTEARNEILESFIQEWGGRAYQFAYRLAGNCDDAHDLVQEALYRVMLGWDRYQTKKPLDAWFMTILRNAFLDRCKRYERKHSVSLDCPIGSGEGHSLADVMAGQDEAVQMRLERQETAKAARRALKGMRREQREVLTMCDMHGLKYDEIAATLKLPAGTVRSRIHRARRTFRGMWPTPAIA